MEQMQSPFSEIEKKLDILIENPDAATPETLGEIKEMIADLREYFDEEEAETEKPEPEEEDGEEKGGLMITIGRAMRKKGMMKTLILGFGFFSASILHAAYMDPIDLPRINSNVSMDIYNTSNTFSTTNLANAVLSSYTATVGYVTVNSTGTNSFLEIYDTSVSTSAAGIKMIAKIQTVFPGTYWYNAPLSSGIAINNYALTPTTNSVANVTIGYRQRR